jgi:hypothetical protein
MLILWTTRHGPIGATRCCADELIWNWLSAVGREPKAESSFMKFRRMIKRTLLGSDAGPRLRRVRGGVLKGHTFPIDVSCQSQRLIGMWEREIAGVMKRLASQVKVACDIGANDGWYTLFLALQPNIKRVFAFEPDPGFVPVIHSALENNGPHLVEKTIVTPAFVGNRDNPQERWCKLDTVLEQAGVQGPIMFKIDVDGGELDVLRGAQQILRRERCCLVIETHSVELERDCVAFLENLGCQTRIIKNAWYRVVLPEMRNIPHNRWLAATTAQSGIRF